MQFMLNKLIQCINWHLAKWSFKMVIIKIIILVVLAIANIIVFDKIVREKNMYDIIEQLIYLVFADLLFIAAANYLLIIVWG